jgi:hypothetical protein
MARRHKPELVIAKVRQGQKMLNDGRPMVEVIMELQGHRDDLVPVAEPVRVWLAQALAVERAGGQMEMIGADTPHGCAGPPWARTNPT